jgi:hypothetical protein
MDREYTDIEKQHALITSLFSLEEEDDDDDVREILLSLP